MINIICQLLPVITMIIGFYFGFKVAKNNQLPEIKTPVEIIEEKKEKKKAKAKATETDVYLENIDNYPLNQKDV